MGICTRDSFEHEIAPVLGQPGGLIGQLRRNLDRCGVSALVTVSIGNFWELEPRPFRLVFSDAMHDEPEIRRNSPFVRRFLAPGSVLACHDINDDNARVLHEFFAFSGQFRVDSLFVGQIAGA